MIRSIVESDWPLVKRIYIQGIETDLATYETPDKVGDYQSWMKSKTQNSVIIYEQKDVVVGWASLSPVSDRCVYGGVAEVSVYVALDKNGIGIGSKLLDHLIKYAESNNIWTLQAGIFPENEASVGLHHKFGFRTVGVREKLGQLHGEWKDVLLLERRSKTIF